jgi:hypothetical protein
VAHYTGKKFYVAVKARFKFAATTLHPATDKVHDVIAQNENKEHWYYMDGATSCALKICSCVVSCILTPNIQKQ